MVHAMRKRGGEGSQFVSLLVFPAGCFKVKTRWGSEMRCHYHGAWAVMWSRRTGGSAIFAAETNESRRGDPAIAAVDVVRRWWQGSFPVCRSLTGSGV